MKRKSAGKSRRKVRIIGVPMDLGAGRRGVDMGPSAIRIAGLHRRLQELKIEVEDAGNIEVRIPEEIHYGEKKQMYLKEIAQVCNRVSQAIQKAHSDSALPLVLGGDHSIAAGTVAGTSSYFRRLNQKVGLLWIDAHTDMNTPGTSPSGNIHGMPLAAILGLGAEELTHIDGYSPKVEISNTVVVGARSIDAGERENIRQAGLRVVTMKEIDMRGMKAVMEEALEIATRGTIGFHCSFDLDVVDPQMAPGVGTPMRGGTTYRESHLALEMVADSRKLLSLELVEVNPVLDVGNATGSLGVELIASALGKKIL